MSNFLSSPAVPFSIIMSGGVIAKGTGIFLSSPLRDYDDCILPDLFRSHRNTDSVYATSRSANVHDKMGTYLFLCGDGTNFAGIIQAFATSLPLLTVS